MQNLINVNKSKLENTFNKAIQEVHQTREYNQNLAQIETIRNVLVKNADVPSELVEKLIELVEENVKIKCGI